MLVLTRSLHTISILPLEDLSLILPQPKVGESLTKSWTEPLSFVSTSQFPQSPRCVKRSLKALFTDVPKDGCLNSKIGKDTFHIPVDRALTCSVEDLPIPEPIEEIMATSTSEFFDLGLEEDIEEMPEEVSDAEEEFGDTS